MVCVDTSKLFRIDSVNNTILIVDDAKLRLLTMVRDNTDRKLKVA